MGEGGEGCSIEPPEPPLDLPLISPYYLDTYYTGMRKFRIDQDFLIEHWHMIYIMPVVFAEIYF